MNPEPREPFVGCVCLQNPSELEFIPLELGLDGRSELLQDFFGGGSGESWGGNQGAATGPC